MKAYMHRRNFMTFAAVSSLTPKLAAKNVPNRYIVQFTDDAKTDPKTLAAAQENVRKYIEKHHGRIITTMDKIMKAFSVEMDAKTADAIRKMPGVSVVRPDRVIKPANPE